MTFITLALMLHLGLAAGLLVVLVKTAFYLAQAGECPFLKNSLSQIAVSTLSVMGSGVLLSWLTQASLTSTCVKFGLYLSLTTVVYGLAWLKLKSTQADHNLLPLRTHYLMASNWAILGVLVLALAV